MVNKSVFSFPVTGDVCTIEAVILRNCGDRTLFGAFHDVGRHIFLFSPALAPPHTTLKCRSKCEAFRTRQPLSSIVSDPASRANRTTSQWSLHWHVERARRVCEGSRVPDLSGAFLPLFWLACSVFFFLFGAGLDMSFRRRSRRAPDSLIFACCLVQPKRKSRPIASLRRRAIGLALRSFSMGHPHSVRAMFNLG
ncbi:hypothetical protein BJV74DRAFT_608759 [Russula compacta]|nr:hypothetical protein BJV74DRAFT_608759 [Russula compacta]